MVEFSVDIKGGGAVYRHTTANPRNTWGKRSCLLIRQNATGRRADWTAGEIPMIVAVTDRAQPADTDDCSGHRPCTPGRHRSL